MLSTFCVPVHVDGNSVNIRCVSHQGILLSNNFESKLKMTTSISEDYFICF